MEFSNVPCCFNGINGRNLQYFPCLQFIMNAELSSARDLCEYLLKGTKLVSPCQRERTVLNVT